MTPIVGPLAKVLGSQKFVVLLLCGIACFVLFLMNRITLEQAGTFMAVTVPAWLIAHGLQDGLTNKAP